MFRILVCSPSQLPDMVNDPRDEEAVKLKPLQSLLEPLLVTCSLTAAFSGSKAQIPMSVPQIGSCFVVKAAAGAPLPTVCVTPQLSVFVPPSLLFSDTSTPILCVFSLF